MGTGLDFRIRAPSVRLSGYEFRARESCESRCSGGKSIQEFSKTRGSFSGSQY